MEYRIFGDTGGHFEQLAAGLTAIGVDLASKTIPSELTIIHCGDLVHKGPDSNGIVALVDELISNNPGRWVQLMGNHEAQYVGGIPFWEDRKISQDTIEALSRWRANGDLKIAHALPAGLQSPNLVLSARGLELPDQPILLTHAGVPFHFWKNILESDRDPLAMAEKLEALADDEFGELGAAHIPGQMLGYNYLNVGPIWASSDAELLGSWVDIEPIDFVQIHGHNYPYDYTRSKWWAGTSRLMQQNSKVNPRDRITTTAIGGSYQIAVDPGFEKTAGCEVQPSLLLL